MNWQRRAQEALTFARTQTKPYTIFHCLLEASAIIMFCLAMLAGEHVLLRELTALDPPSWSPRRLRFEPDGFLVFTSDEAESCGDLHYFPEYHVMSFVGATYSHHSDLHYFVAAI